MIKVNNVYYMLAYIYKTLNKKTDRFYNEEEFPSIYDLFAELLIKGIHKQIKRGLNKDYKEKLENIVNIKGKIEITESIKQNTIMSHKMTCCYDEYVVDSYFNRIVKTTASYLLKSKKIQEKKRSNALKKTIYYFSEVKEIYPISSIRFQNLTFNKNNESYKFLLEICRLVLQHLYIGSENGKLLFHEYLEDKAMASLYESFLREYFKSNYKNFQVFVEKKEWPYDKTKTIGNIKNLPKMKTDITIFDKEKQTKLIIDAKFYQSIFSQYFDKDLFNASNMYQIFSYVKTENQVCKGKVLGMILYAKTENESIGWNEFVIDGNTFVITDIDLMGDFSLIDTKLQDIIEMVYR